MTVCVLGMEDSSVHAMHRFKKCASDQVDICIAMHRF